MNIFQSIPGPLIGQGLYPGTVMGVLKTIRLSDLWMVIDDNKSLFEQERLKSAMNKVIEILKKQVGQALSNNSQVESFLLYENQLQILEDPQFQKMLNNKIFQTGYSSEAVCQSFQFRNTSRFMSNPSKIINDRGHMFASIFEQILEQLSRIEEINYSGNERETAVYAVKEDFDGSETKCFYGPCTGLVFDRAIPQKETALCLENLPVPAVRTDVDGLLKNIRKDTLIYLDGSTGSIVGKPAHPTLHPSWITN